MIPTRSSSPHSAHHLACALAAVLAIVLLSGSGAYAAPPGLGTDGRGVSIIHRGGVSFSYGPAAAARYKLIAGKAVAIQCGRVTVGPGGIMTSRRSHALQRRAPHRRSPIASGYRNRADYCTLGSVKPGRRETFEAIVPLTRLGAVFLAQQTDVRQILTVFFLPESFVAQNEQKILAAIDGVALPTETSPVPAGKAGLYISRSHLYIAKRDTAGVLLFVQNDAPTVRTNLLQFVSDRSAGAPFLGQTLRLS